MIRYALICDNKHEFESWFANSAAFDKQAGRGLVTCPVCGSAKVEKAIMAPRLARADVQAPAAPEPAETTAETTETSDTTQTSTPADKAPVAMLSPQEKEFRNKLKEFRDFLVKNSDNVGPRFPEEARKMHYGETEHRSIYGEASREEAEALAEEGIPFQPLPVLPDERN